MQSKIRIYIEKYTKISKQPKRGRERDRQIQTWSSFIICQVQDPCHGGSQDPCQDYQDYQSEVRHLNHLSGMKSLSSFSGQVSLQLFLFFWQISCLTVVHSAVDTVSSETSVNNHIFTVYTYLSYCYLRLFVKLFAAPYVILKLCTLTSTYFV